MTNLEKYNAIFMKVLELKPESLGEDCTVCALERWDSMAHMNLVYALEEDFDVMFDPEDILKFRSYNGGLEILKQYGVDFEC